MSYQEDLILSIYGRGEPGLAMADPLPKGPDRDKPVQAPGKDGTPSSPYLPGKSPMPSKLANLTDGTPDASIMNYVTEKGYFLDGQGNSYLQIGGKFTDKMEYNPDLHGLPVPLAKRRKSLKIAQFPRLSTGEPMTNIEQQQGLEVLRKLQGNQKRKQLKIFMDQYMKGV